MSVGLPNLPKNGEDELHPEWGRFFLAESDEELEELPRRNPVMEKAKGALDFLSAEPNLKEIAHSRELGECAYNTAIYQAREQGRREGLIQAVDSMLASGLSRKQIAEIPKVDLDGQ